MQSLTHSSTELFGRDLKAPLVPTSAMGKDTFHWFSMLLTPSTAQNLTLAAALALQLGETQVYV